MILDIPELSVHINSTQKSIDAVIFVGGSLLQSLYSNLIRASQRGVRMRFLFANPYNGWIDELVRPTGIDIDDYLQQRIYVNVSRALLLGKVADVRWQPFPIPWWFVVADQQSVYLRGIDFAGSSLPTLITEPEHLKYYLKLFEAAWSKAPSVEAVLTSSPANNISGALRVFLCHASGDKPEVRKLYRRLVRDNVLPWLDEENLLPGQDWEHEISRAIQQSDVIIVCLSNSSIEKRGFVQREIRFAMRVAEEMPQGSIFIIPARLEQCNVPDELSHLQWVDLFKPEGYSVLLRALRVARQH